MQIKTVNALLSLSEQILVSDVALLAEQGIKTIIVNRPDGEGADQVNVEEIMHAAKSVDIAVKYVPVTSGMVSDEQAIAFGAFLGEAEGKVHAYCRTGVRVCAHAREMRMNVDLSFLNI